MRLDLHMHSACSDGTMPPREVIALCADAGLSAVALTDHDTIDGLREAIRAGDDFGVEVIPGIEISAGNNPEVHILGYYPDPEDAALAEWLDSLRAARAVRAARMAARLREIGLQIDLEDIQAEADERAGLGRTHVAIALVKAGYASGISEAFARYLKPGKPGYISRNNPPVDDVLEKLNALGMVPVLAHGALLPGSLGGIAGLISHMAGKGLRGLECYHSAYDRTMERFMLGQAKEHNLLVTGGSDYHGANRPGVKPGDAVGNWRDAEACLEELRRGRGERSHTETQRR